MCIRDRSGRGFSVVATQISKLADQSNSTAENVADIIANIIAEADRMVEMMGDVKNKIHEQQKKLDDTMDKSCLLYTSRSRQAPVPADTL